MEQGRLLIIEDDSLMRDFVMEALGRNGHHVAAASSGKQGLELLGKSNYHVVVTDLKMAGMDGLQVLEAVRREHPDVAVIVMTAYATVETAIRAMKNGAFDYIVKPFAADEIELAVDKALYQHRLEWENRYLRCQIQDAYGLHDIVGNSPQMKAVYEQIRKVASSKSTVLIRGESGTGKELVARAIHLQSPRKDRAFIKVNCAALSTGVLESELFGHEKGSFTGAFERRIGRFELADGGTLLLDEVSEMNADLQAKLLRAIQEKEFERVGGNKPIVVDVRIIGTTNKKIEDAIQEKSFRLDLFYRLNVIPIFLPPLRERKDDIPLLVEHFIAKHCKENNRKLKAISKQAMQMLTEHSWPGNIRELENAVERAVVLSSQDLLDVHDFSVAKAEVRRAAEDEIVIEPGMTIEEAEKALILKTLDKFPRNKAEAARILGISVRTLRNKLNQYALGDRRDTTDGWFQVAAR